jgi:hypothetical protein
MVQAQHSRDNPSIQEAGRLGVGSQPGLKNIIINKYIKIK